MQIFIVILITKIRIITDYMNSTKIRITFVKSK